MEVANLEIKKISGLKTLGILKLIKDISSHLGKNPEDFFKNSNIDLKTEIINLLVKNGINLDTSLIDSLDKTNAQEIYQFLVNQGLNQQIILASNIFTNQLNESQIIMKLVNLIVDDIQILPKGEIMTGKFTNKVFNLISCFVDLEHEVIKDLDLDELYNLIMSIWEKIKEVKILANFISTMIPAKQTKESKSTENTPQSNQT